MSYCSDEPNDEIDAYDEDQSIRQQLKLRMCREV